MVTPVAGTEVFWLMMPWKSALPPLKATNVALLDVPLAVPRLMFPPKTDASAVLPPSVMVAVLPDCTVIARPTVKAPPVNSDALLVADVAPRHTAELALPKGPAAPEGALVPAITVPALMVVVPV